MTAVNVVAPLDLSSYADVQIDSPELAAYKIQVRDVAMKYANNHNWCSVVKKALKEVGITDTEQSVQVDVTTSFGLTAQVKVPLSAVLNTTVGEQMVAVAGAVNSVLTTGTVKLSITPESIVSMVAVAAPDTSSGLWLYPTQESRVRHRMRTYSGREYTTLEQMTSVQDRYRSFTTACGDTLYQLPSEHSPRGENRNCRKCEGRPMAVFVQ